MTRLLSFPCAGRASVGARGAARSFASLVESYTRPTGETTQRAQSSPRTLTRSSRSSSPWPTSRSRTSALPSRASSSSLPSAAGAPGWRASAP